MENPVNEKKILLHYLKSNVSKDDSQGQRKTQLYTFHLASPAATSQNNVWSLIYIETPSPIIPPESTRNLGYTYPSASLLILIFVAIVNPFFVRDGLVMK